MEMGIDSLYIYSCGWKIMFFSCALPCICSPRVYPEPFAQALCHLIEDIKRNCRGQPQHVGGQTPTALSVMQSEWSSESHLWSFVNFAEIFNYLRGSTKLQIPHEWRSIIPKKLG